MIRTIESLIKYHKVCRACFQSDDRRCSVCHGRQVIDLIPATLADGSQTYLEIIA